MEIEHEELGIEDLFLQDKDEKIEILITIPDRGKFKAYVTPVTYGQEIRGRSCRVCLDKSFLQRQW